MAICFREVFNFVKDILYVVLALLVVTLAIMELLFCPLLVIRYYVPMLLSYIHSGGGGLDHSSPSNNDDHLVVIFFYVILILLSILNTLASLMLFLAIFVIGYHDRTIAYDTVMLLSVSLSLGLILHRWQTGYDFYGQVVVKDYYWKTARFIGDWVCTAQNSRNTLKSSPKKSCHYTDMYYWHQTNKCCGWTSPNDLLHIKQIHRKKEPPPLTNQTFYDDKLLLPNYCCENRWQFLRFYNLNQTIQQLSSSSESFWRCTLNSINLYKQTCNQFEESFLSMRGITIIGHPTHNAYISIKLLASMVYAFTKHHMLPQSPGSFSLYLQP